MTKFESQVGTLGTERKSADSDEFQKDLTAVRVRQVKSNLINR